MSVRILLRTIGAACVALLPQATFAQAPWTPPQGEVALSGIYQWLDADRHIFSNLTRPELTPLEHAGGIDLQSNSRSVGRVQSHAFVLDGEVGVTDRFALNGSLAFIAPRYRGRSPHPGTADNGAFHGAVQDVQIGARYMMAGDLWAFTPFTSFVTPVTDYEVLAHAAQGLGLTMLEVGTSLGRILLHDGAARGYVQGTYGYSFTESPVEDVGLNRSRAAFEAGVFLGRFALQGVTNWRYVHGGLEWSDVGFGRHEHFEGHDQSAATREWRWGAGVSYQLTSGTSIELSYGDFIWGANTHDARAVAVGWSWGFEAFGGPTLGGGLK